MLLSILIPTYQQEQYIGECIASVLAQEIDFDIEVLVGDDCSSDRTADVIQTFTDADDRVILYRWDKNEGGLKNIDKLLSHARGDFVTILEGDDYFYSTHHLQLAVKRLQEDNQASFAASNFCSLIDSKLVRTSKFNFTYPKKLKFWHLALGNFIQMGSIVYRRALYPRIPSKFIDLPLGDYPMTLSLLQNAYGIMLPHDGLVYRIHGGGVWSMKDIELKREKTIETIKIFMDNTYSFAHKFLLRQYIAWLRRKLSLLDFLGKIFYVGLYFLRAINLRLRG